MRQLARKCALLEQRIDELESAEQPDGEQE